MKHIVKRKGHKEAFDERKIYASCYAACIGMRMKPQEAEKICENVSQEIKVWIAKKKEVSSTKIFKQVIQIIKKQNKEVAFLYGTHRDII